MVKTIELKSHNPQWLKIFEDEARLIRHILTEKCLQIHHVGSTAVAGLYAKPIIDMILVAKDFDFVIKALEKSGYLYKGEYNIPFRRFFSKNLGHLEVHLHAYEEGNPEIELNVIFRDYLRCHPPVRDAYAALKRVLVSQEVMHTKVDGVYKFKGYTLGKYEFIQNVLKQAGFNQLCIRFCAHPMEWAAYHRIRREQIFEGSGIEYDPNHSTITDPNHYHLVLYKGTAIIGVAHLEFLTDNVAALRPFAIDKAFQNQGMGSKFLRLIEKWLQLQGKTIIHLHANQTAQTFYQRLGYVVMTFHDLQQTVFSETVDMGKVL